MEDRMNPEKGLLLGFEGFGEGVGEWKSLKYFLGIISIRYKYEILQQRKGNRSLEKSQKRF